MPCLSTPRRNQTLAERIEETTRALRRLEQSLTAGRVRVTIASNGAVSFAGWQDRDDLSDVCAFRSLTAENSAALRIAVQRAEFQSGRKVNLNAVAAGWHSHDQGKTWSKH